MSFLYPAFLYALLAALIPIIIHFFNFRKYKTVYFSNIRFIKNVNYQTRSKSVLKNILLLIVRIAIIVALVIAFAKPYIFSGEKNIKNENSLIAVYIDNSFSTQNENKYGKIIETQKNAALKILEAYPENQKFYFINNTFSSKFSVPETKSIIKEYILETKPVAQVRKISEVINHLKFNAANFSSDKHKNFTLYILSDLQKNVTDIKQIKPDTFINLVFVPSVNYNSSNLIIDSVWFENPNRMLNMPEELFVSVTNKSDQKFYNIPLNLYLNDTLKTISSVNLNENQSIVTKLNFINTSKGIVSGKVEISDFPIVFDNNFYFSYTISDKKNVLIISNNTENKFIDAVFENDDYINISRSNVFNLKTSELNNFDIIILDALKEISTGLAHEFSSYCSEGGTILFFPNANPDIKNINTFLSDLGVDYILSEDSAQTKTGNFNFDADVFRNVFENSDIKIEQAKIQNYFVFSNITDIPKYKILTGQNNENLITKYKVSNGELYLFAFEADIKFGNTVVNPVWAPMIYNMIIFGNKNSKLYYTIGKSEPAEIFAKNFVNDENQIHIKSKNNQTDIIPQTQISGKQKIKLFFTDNFSENGNYFATLNQKEISAISLNYDRAESETEYYTQQQISDLLKASGIKVFTFFNSDDKLITEKIETAYKGKELYLYFIYIAILLIVAEILIIKFIK